MYAYSFSYYSIKTLPDLQSQAGVARRIERDGHLSAVVIDRQFVRVQFGSQIGALFVKGYEESVSIINSIL
jgi:hypothetical protein